MGSHALGSLYQRCLMLSNMSALEGFTPAYLGHIGFFLFFITASYGQLDRIVDDGSAKMRTSRFIALIAPICAALLYIPIYLIESMPIETKIACALVWAPGLVSLYFNLKHAIIPNLDYNFVKVILKALPILYYAIVVSDKRETLFTASMALGVGFAVL